ncbi:hypothetical protein JOD82_001956 [Paenibacillus sp. 1182]|nr:hypothetical protein [Paenibacillus sp. 1182]
MEQELTIDFENGKVLRGENVLMTTEELLFLIGSVVQYNNMCPIEQSQEFVADLHERAGTGFTTEQFVDLKKAMKDWQGV